jgi:4-amino-4-deoxy-L-arabinose transferase-like glycosyltransferase
MSLRPLAVLLIVAVVFKAIYLVQYMALPILNGPAFDSLVYLRQAAAVHAGQFGDASLLGFSPLYGYVLAASGAPDDLVRIVVVQFLLGSVNLVLIYQIGVQLFDRRAALISAWLYLGYGLLVFYETKILAEILGLTLSLGTLALLTSSEFGRGRMREAICAGALMGLAALARPNVIVVMPFLAVAVLLSWRADPDAQFDDRPRAPRLRRAAGWLLGIALVVGANGSWNYHNTGFFVPVIFGRTTSQRASQTQWTGDLSVFSTLGGGNVSAFDMVDRAQARLDGRAPDAPKDTKIDVTGIVVNAPAKLLATVRNTDTGFMYGYYGERTEVPILRLVSVSFGSLGVLGLLGAVLTIRARRWRKLLPLLPWACAAFASVVLLHPDNRYRLPLVLSLLVLSGAGVAALSRTYRERRTWWIAAPIALLCLYFSYATLTYQLQDPAMWQLRMAESAISANDSKEAERRIARAQAMAGDQPHIQQRIAYLRGLPSQR